MSLSSKTLSAIQQAGAAVFAADAELKNATKDYAERVTAAMGSNPFGLGNDGLFENWKLVARLSQAMAGIEEELKKVHQLASELTTDDGPTVRALAAPAPVVESTGNAANDLAPTDVRVKRKKKTVKPIVRAAKASARATPAKLVKLAKPTKPTKPTKPRVAAAGATATAAATAALAGNPAKLLKHLARVLKTNAYTEINQTASAQATGIPLGSMTAAIKKLIALDRLMAGPAGSYRLIKNHSR